MRATWALVAVTAVLCVVTAMLAQAEKHRSETPVAGQEVATTQHR